MSRCDVLFSVVIPLYNKANTIKNTIESVLLQTEKNFEIIIVDDGSTDNSAQVVRSIKDKRINLIQQKNQGVSVARNNAVLSAKGKYISFLDADDFWEPNYLYVTKELFEKYPTAKIACPTYKVKYKKKEITPMWHDIPNDKDCIVEDFLETATSKFWIVNSSCITIERKILMEAENKFPEGETVYEDFDLWLRLGLKYSLAHSNKVCSTYNRMTETNARTMHKNKVLYSKTFMKTLDMFYNSNELSECQKLNIKKIKDRRMVAYIFSLLVIHQREKAKFVIKDWYPNNTYRKYKLGLIVASNLPFFLIKFVQGIRYRIF